MSISVLNKGRKKIITFACSVHVKIKIRGNMMRKRKLKKRSGAVNVYDVNNYNSKIINREQ